MSAPTRLAALLVAAGLALLATSAGAQVATTGRITGRVINTETGTPILRAQVGVIGTGLRAVTDLDGRYYVPDVPVGFQSVEVRQIGYVAKTVTGVQIVAGETTVLDLTLSPTTFDVEAITVTAEAERGTVGRAIEEQRNALNVVNALSAEQIAKSPDSDAGQAAQRVSGVTVQDGRYVFVRGLGERYTQTSLNGSRIPSPEPERKMVPLDLFPAGLLQTITASKTFTPNLQGDFSGAQVDIRTREFPARRQLAISFSTSYNSAATGATLPMGPRVGGEWLARGTGPRLIPAVVRDTRTPQPGPQSNAMVNAMRNAWSIQDQSGWPSSSFGLSLGGNDRILGQRLGYLLSTTYSLADEAQVDASRENPEGDHYAGTVGRRSVLVGGLLNLSTMLGGHTRVSLNNTYNRSADNEARIESGFYENHGTNIQIERLRYVERSVRHHQIQTQHQFGVHRLNWSASVSGVSRQEPDRSEFVTWLDPDVPTWYNQEGAFRAYGGLTEDSFEGSLDYQLGVVSGGSQLRFGSLYRTTSRDAFDAGYALRTRDWAATDPRWQLPAESLFDGRFATPADSLFELGIFNAGGNYGADERILAGYAMLELAVSRRVRFVGGARLERSELEVAYEDVLGNTGVADPTYTDVLPAAMLIFDLGTSQKLRLSASQTLARPEYREIAPICYRSGLGEEQRCGNPDLRRTLIQNYDLRWEWYPGVGEVLSAAVFAKRFDGPIEARYQGRSGTNSLWFENARSALNYGIELEVARGLGFLAHPLTPFSLFANATLMRSEVTTGVEGDLSRAMTGQAPYVVNAGLTWTSPSRSTSATVLYNVVGDRIVNARASGQTIADMVELPRPGLDVSLRFPVAGALSGKVDLKNLLDSPYEVRQGELLRYYYRSGRSVSLGFSIQP
jgi:hypothetical protein